MTLFGPDGNAIKHHEIHDPQRVADRIKKRSLRQYEDISKKLLNYQKFGIRNHWPVNITDDLALAALMLAEVYVAKREGIIST